MSLSLLLNGAKGRMGQAIVAAAKDAGLTICAAVDIGDNPAPHIGSCDVVIDFSFHAATRSMIELAVANQKPLVIGTTGHSANEKAALLKLAAPVPCVWAGNFSVGVNLLFALTRRAAQVLGSDYDAEVVEMHEIILEERKLTAAALRHGRQGITGERTSTEVGIHSLRGGDVVGDHTVMFAALGERIELTHRTTDRAILARGALRAAQWVVHQKPGVYDMQDVLGLK
jgi:4-hydroxy-tetrahydrodipicolinate reductase